MPSGPILKKKYFQRDIDGHIFFVAQVRFWTILKSPVTAAHIQYTDNHTHTWFVFYDMQTCFRTSSSVLKLVTMSVYKIQDLRVQDLHVMDALRWNPGPVDVLLCLVRESLSVFLWGGEKEMCWVCKGFFFFYGWIKVCTMNNNANKSYAEGKSTLLFNKKNHLLISSISVQNYVLQIKLFFETWSKMSTRFHRILYFYFILFFSFVCF